MLTNFGEVCFFVGAECVTSNRRLNFGVSAPYLDPDRGILAEFVHCGDRGKL